MGSVVTETLYCRYCAVPVARRQSMSCDDENCRRLWRNERNAAYSRNYTATHGVSWRTNKIGYKRCVHCNGPVRKDGERCVGCKTRGVRFKRALAKAGRAAVGTKGRKTWVSKMCGRCGSQFLTSRTEQTLYCTTTCRRTDKASRRRAREAGAPAISADTRIAVYLRDSWTCQLCGLPTDRKLRTPHPEAPTIDHVIPLAGGGSHVLANWQTAHSYCNSVKRDLVKPPPVDELRALLNRAVGRWEDRFQPTSRRRRKQLT
jgi:hypothetical protein